MKHPSFWITKKEAAMYLKLSVRSIEHLIKKQLLPAHKLGGRVLLDVREIDDCVRGHRIFHHRNDPNARL
ncbi:MAG: helix-turn-helix domain-containing protein [Flavobacteriales bacterium]